MKKYQIILVLLLPILSLSWAYLDYETLRKNRNVFLSDLNITIIDMQKKLLEKSQSFYDANCTFWEMKSSEILKNREKKQLLEREKNSTNDLKRGKSLNLKNRVICLGKECWEFLGVVTMDNKVTVTLLSKNKASELKTFQLHDMLLENIEIIDIQSDGMNVMNKTTNKKISLKLFEVDIDKYLPKKSIKEKNE